MSFTQLLAILRIYRWSILAMVVVAVGVTWAFASTLPKQYTAKARVMLPIASDDPILAVEVNKATADSYVRTEISMVTAEAVAADVVTKLGWTDDPGVVAVWQADTGGAGDVVSWAAQRLRRGIAAAQLADSAILEIYYSAADLESAKRVVGLVRAAYIDNSLRLRVAAAQRASAWNRAQALSARTALENAEKARIDFMSKNGIAFDWSTAGLEQAELSSLSRRSATGAYGGASDGQPSGLVAGLKQQLYIAEIQLGIEQARGPQNPQIQLATIARDRLRDALARAVAFSRAGASASDAMIQQNRHQLDINYLAARLKVIARAPLYDTLAELDREIALRRSIYEAAVARVESYDAIAAAPSGLAVIGDVIGFPEPSYPDIPVMMLVAGLLSLILGVALAIFDEMLHRRVRGTEDLVFFTHAPLLAEVTGERKPTRNWLYRLTHRARWGVAAPALSAD